MQFENVDYNWEKKNLKQFKSCNTSFSFMTVSCFSSNFFISNARLSARLVSSDNFLCSSWTWLTRSIKKQCFPICSYNCGGPLQINKSPDTNWFFYFSPSSFPALPIFMPTAPCTFTGFIFNIWRKMHHSSIQAVLRSQSVTQPRHLLAALLWVTVTVGSNVRQSNQKTASSKQNQRVD